MYVQQILELSVLCSTFTLFLDFCYRDGNILEWWPEWWAKFFIGRPKHTGKKKLEEEGFLEFRDYWFDRASRSFWFKAGYCVVCANVWHSLIICFLFGFYDLTYWLYCIPVILLSNFIVRFFHDKLL